MKFEERRDLALVEVSRFLERYTPPRGMSPEAQDATMNAVAEAFARRLPVGNQDQFAANLSKVFERVADAHNSYAWPPQGIFVEAMVFDVTAKPALAAPKVDAVEALARKMELGEGVCERAIWGEVATRAVNSGAVSQQVLDEYRRGSVKMWRQTYRANFAAMLHQKYGSVVLAYLPAQEAAE